MIRGVRQERKNSRGLNVAEVECSRAESVPIAAAYVSGRWYLRMFDTVVSRGLFLDCTMTSTKVTTMDNPSYGCVAPSRFTVCRIFALCVYQVPGCPAALFPPLSDLQYPLKQPSCQ